MLCGLRGIKIEMPKEAIEDCAGSGPVDDAVEYWADRISVPSILTRELQVKILLESGGCDREHIHLETDADLWRKCVWIAACNCKEENREEFE